MLNIIYSRGRSKEENNSPQGKKTLMRFLQSEYGVIPIKKYTSQPAPNEEADENLIYMNLSSVNEQEFIKDIKKHFSISDTIFCYSRIKSRKLCFYGINSSDIKKALEDDKQYALVCTNIKCLHDIRSFAERENLLKKIVNDRYVFQLRAYCLVRQDDIHSSTSEYEKKNEKINGFLKKFFAWMEGNPEIDDSEFQKLILQFRDLDIPIDGRPYYLPHGEDLELDFFRNVSLFNNLLLIPNCGNLKTQTGLNTYRDEVSQIVEKYMGLEKINSGVFVIHPFGPMKFKIDGLKVPNLFSMDTDETKVFKSFINAIVGNNSRVCYADEVQNKHEGAEYLVPFILKEIERSSIVICDFRHLNHNCIYEAGFAFALKEKFRKKVFFIVPAKQKELLERLGFDVKGNSFILYDLEKMRGNETEARKLITACRKSLHLDNSEEALDEATLKALTIFN